MIDLLVKNGSVVTREPLTDRELLDFPEVGTLEAFNTDGLRSLIHTIDCPEMSEKTLRYPGHVDKIILLKESGFLSSRPLSVGSKKIKPIDLTARLLFPLWELKKDEEDFTVMRIIVEGQKGKKILEYTYDLYDSYDREKNVTSMARTTGYTATTAVRMIAGKIFAEKGLFPPEKVGMHKKCVDFMLTGLKKKNIHFTENIQEVTA